jgi:hypothetical protein
MNGKVFFADGWWQFGCDNGSVYIVDQMESVLLHLSSDNHRRAKASQPYGVMDRFVKVELVA